MRVLVTGGAGYIGSHTVKTLCNFGHEPIIVDDLVTSSRSNFHTLLGVPLIKTCISNNKEISKILNGKHSELVGTIHENKSVEAVIHLAAFSVVHESIRNPILYYKNNLSHTISLLESIYEKNFNGLNKENAVPIIFSSTCSTYGIHKNYPITEEFSQNPINPYAKSKYFVEEILKDLSNVFNIKSIILRYFNVGGASRDMLIGENRDNETHLIPLAVKTALGINDNLAIYGNDYETPDGTCIRDYVHVCDVAEAHVKAMELLYLENKKRFDPLKKRLNNCNIFNLGTGKGYSVKEIIKVTEEVTKKKLKVTFQDRRVGDPPILLASCEKFKKVFDWEPKHRNIRRIIEDSYNWEKYLLNKFHKNH